MQENPAQPPAWLRPLLIDTIAIAIVGGAEDWKLKGAFAIRSRLGHVLTTVRLNQNGADAARVRRSLRRRLLTRKAWQVKNVLKSLMNQIVETRAGGRVRRPAATREISEVRVSTSRCC